MRAIFCAFPFLVLSASPAQEATPEPATPANTLSVQANLVVVPAVVFDKRALVKDLTKESFAIAVDGKPQTIRYFDRDADVPLTVGLLVDISHSQDTVLDEEQKASQSFLDSLLAPASGSRPADKAFVMQFARTAELLQDVTDSHPLLQAGLKQIGTQAPGADEDDAANSTNPTDPSTNGSNGQPGNGNGNGGGTNGTPSGNSGGYGRGPYGRNPNGNSGGQNGNVTRRRGGTVLYDGLFLASNDVMAKQNGRRALVLLTDGVDRHSKESLTEAIEAAQRANTVVYAIYYKGEDHRNGGFSNGYPGGDYPRRDPYDPYGRYPSSYPGGGGRPGSDGTYADPDGKKILQRICGETGGAMFEAKGKGAVEKIYTQIGDELRAQYRLGFTPTEDAASAGYHKLQVTLTKADAKKDEVQTRDGYYSGVGKR